LKSVPDEGVLVRSADVHELRRNPDLAYLPNDILSDCLIPEPELLEA